jgi:anti-sigma-K factor RskA
MALSEHDQLTIREYLLGKLTEDEQAQIEERLMVEDDLFEELEISKGELIEDYRAGELNQQEKTSFEQFLATPEGGQRHVFAVAMNCVGRKRRLSLLERLELWLRMPRWVVAAAAAAVVLVIVAVVWVRIGQQPRKFVAVTLTNNNIRRAANQDQYPLVTVSPDTTELRVSLTLPEPAASGTRYEVKLDNRVSTIPVEVTGHDANSVSAVIPIREIPPGLYALTISEIKPDGTTQAIPGQYFFNRQ